MHIQVTQEDIDASQRSRPFECPILRALARTVPTVCWHVTLYSIWWHRIDADNTPIRRYETSIDARNFISNFDGRQAVWPFEFDLPDPTSPLTAI